MGFYLYSFYIFFESCVYKDYLKDIDVNGYLFLLFNFGKVDIVFVFFGDVIVVEFDCCYNYI